MNGMAVFRLNFIYQNRMRTQFGPWVKKEVGLIQDIFFMQNLAKGVGKLHSNMDAFICKEQKT